MTANLGTGYPVAANVYENAVPTVAVPGGVAAVNTGACGAGETVIVSGPLAVSGLTPFAALTVKVNVPAFVGVPDRAPVAASRPRPSGSAPDATAKPGAGLLDAVNVYPAYALPTVAVPGGASAENAGAVNAPAVIVIVIDGLTASGAVRTQQPGT